MNVISMEAAAQSRTDPRFRIHRYPTTLIDRVVRSQLRGRLERRGAAGGLRGARELRRGVQAVPATGGFCQGSGGFAQSSADLFINNNNLFWEKVMYVYDVGTSCPFCAVLIACICLCFACVSL